MTLYISPYDLSKSCHTVKSIQNKDNFSNTIYNYQNVISGTFINLVGSGQRTLILLYIVLNDPTLLHNSLRKHQADIVTALLVYELQVNTGGKREGEQVTYTSF